MSVMTQAPASIEDWLLALLSAAPADQRSVAIAGSDAGFALTPVVCTMHGGTFNGIIGAYRHVANSDMAWRAKHPEDGPNASTHRLGSLRAAVREDAPPPLPWSTDGCRSCGARVIWAITSRGKKMPVDVGTDPNGNIMLVAQSSASIEEPPFANVLHTEADKAGVPADQLHMSHFATCKHAKDWRRSP